MGERVDPHGHIARLDALSLGGVKGLQSGRLGRDPMHMCNLRSLIPLILTYQHRLLQDIMTLWIYICVYIYIYIYICIYIICILYMLYIYIIVG